VNAATSISTHSKLSSATRAARSAGVASLCSRGIVVRSGDIEIMWWGYATVHTAARRGVASVNLVQISLLTTPGAAFAERSGAPPNFEPGRPGLRLRGCGCGWGMLVQVWAAASASAAPTLNAKPISATPNARWSARHPQTQPIPTSRARLLSLPPQHPPPYLEPSPPTRILLIPPHPPRPFYSRLPD
jgi:hypothetical protein